MTMQINIKDQYLEKFKEFINSLPSDAVEIDNISDNSISLDEAKQKVQKAINNISSKQSLDLDTAFTKLANY